MVAKLINKPCFEVGKLNKHILRKKYLEKGIFYLLLSSGLTSEVCCDLCWIVFFTEEYSII